MGRNRVTNTHQLVIRKIMHGYGRGEGMSFKPWLTGHEFASKGIYVRMMGLTIPRMYVFFSRLEADLFIYYDTDSSVTDILDQYYMDLSVTLRLAESMGIKHPWLDKYYHVMTADLVFLKDGQWHARSVKSSSELHNPRTMEKLSLEKAYFRELGIEWKIVTEKQINRYKVQNLQWLYYEPRLQDLTISSQLCEKAQMLFYKLYMESRLPVPPVIDQVEAAYQLPKGTGMAVMKELIISGKIPVDLEKPINRLDPLRPQRKGGPDERYLSYGKPNH